MKAVESFLALSEEALSRTEEARGEGGGRKGEMRDQGATIYDDGSPAHHEITHTYFRSSSVFPNFFWLRSRACCDFWALEPFPIIIL
jgi:hypothetical protein